LSLFTSLYILLFFKYCHFSSGRALALILCGVFALMAVATKSIQAMLFGPALFLYALFQKDRVDLLLSKTMLATAIIFMVAILMSFAVLYFYNANLFQSTIDNNIINRFLGRDETALGFEFLYYFKWLLGEKTVWAGVLPVFVVMVFHGSLSTAIEKSIIYYLLFCSAIYLLVIEVASRKLVWYAIPLYPLLAVAGGLGVEKIFRLAQSKVSAKQGVFIAVILFFSLLSVFYIVHLVQYQESIYKEENENHYGFMIRYLKQQRPDLKRVHIVQKGFVNDELNMAFYNAPTLFYVKSLSQSGYQLTFSTVQNERSAPGAVLLFCGRPISSALNAKYQLTTVVSLPPCKVSIVDDIY